MVRLLTYILYVFWSIGFFLLIVHNVFISYKITENNFILLVSVLLFIAGVMPVLLAMILYYRIKRYKNKIQKKLINLTIDEMYDVLNKTKKYDFMDNNGTIKNWKGLIFFLKLGVPKYIITKDVINEIQTNPVLKEDFIYYKV